MCVHHCKGTFPPHLRLHVVNPYAMRILCLKHIAFCALLCLPFAAWAQLTPPGHLIDKLPVAEAAQAWQQARTTTQPSDVQAGSFGYDVQHVIARWRIHPDSGLYIKGDVITSFLVGKAALPRIAVNLDATLAVSAVQLDGQTVAQVLRRPNTVSADLVADSLIAVLAQPLLPGTWHTLRIVYGGAPQAGGGFGAFSSVPHQAVPAIWTLSQPYGQGRWWPTKLALDDKIDTLDVFLTCPQPYVAVSNGVLLTTDTLGKSITWHYRHGHPIAPYLVAIAATNYKVFDKVVALPSGLMHVQHFVWPEEVANWVPNMKYTDSLLLLFERLAGPYPFRDEKYANVQFGWGGGMEHQTTSYVANIDFELNAHEMAHQWFGDATTCGTWQDIWLNEGFAVYFSGLGYQNLGNGRYWRPFLQTYRSSALRAQGSVWCNDTSRIDRIFDGALTYAKGGMVLHLLRHELGDSLFFAGIRAYRNGPRQSYGSARTANLQAALERTAGKPLGRIFQAWVYGQSYPDYTLQWSQNGTRATLQLNQKAHHGTGEFYTNSLPIRAYSATGDSLTVELQPQYDGQTFFADVPFPIASIAIDPDLWVLSTGLVHHYTGSSPARIVVGGTAETPTTLTYTLPEGEQPKALYITDMAGRVLHSANAAAGLPSFGTLQLDFAVARGAYVAVLVTDKGRYGARFMR